MHTFELIASLIIGLIALYWTVEILVEYFTVRRWVNSPWREQRLTHAFIQILGLKLASFPCTSETACMNWGFFFAFVTHALYIGAMWGIVQLIVFKFS